ARLNDLSRSGTRQISNAVSVGEFADVDKAIQGCGKHMVAMWQSLGVSACLTQDDELQVFVR
ncbi:hypothetical protein ACFUC2_30645, partial [[Kitasatospora] papulosa]|uniref:hypothetical protein n=1 Tax=[Kitasatospora] papulosa TaxID=1464011 RepID=UPI003631A7D7